MSAEQEREDWQLSPRWGPQHLSSVDLECTCSCWPHLASQVWALAQQRWRQQEPQARCRMQRLLHLPVPSCPRLFLSLPSMLVTHKGETLHHPMKEPGGDWLCAIRSDPGLSCQPPRWLLTWKQRGEPFRQNFSIPIFSLGDAPWLPSSPTDSWLSVKSQRNKKKEELKRAEGETRLRRLLSGHKIPASLGLPLLQASSWLMSVSTCESWRRWYTPHHV